jgi:hypothetical protein
MSNRIVFAVRLAPDITSPVKMYWRCSCGTDGIDPPGLVVRCSGCRYELIVPDGEVHAPATPLGLMAGGAAPETSAPLDLRELAYRVLTSPDLHLHGHKGGGVGLHCRACPNPGAPVAFVGAQDDERGSTEIAYVSSVSSMWAVAAMHLVTHHNRGEEPQP